MNRPSIDASRPQSTRLHPSKDRRRRPDRRALIHALEPRLHLSAADPDPTFGTGGIAAPPAPVYSYATAVVPQSTGKLLVLSSTTTDPLTYTGRPSQVTRYNPDGSVDATFGTGGSIPVPADATSLYLLTGDRFLVAAGTPGTPVQLARYTSAGTPDLTFGSAGQATPPSLGSYYDVRADGSVVGVSRTRAGVTVTRLRPDLTPDPSFDTDGVAFIPAAVAGAAFYTSDVRLDAAGRVVVSATNDDGQAVFLQLRPDGSPDPSFDADGVATLSLPGWVHYGYPKIALQPDGRILAAVDASGGLVVARLTAAGALDPSFDADGVTTTSAVAPSVTHGYKTEVAVAPDGTITAANANVILRLSSAGSQLSSFGSAGVATFGTPTAARLFDAPALYDVATLPDGSVVAVGSFGPTGSGPQFLVERFTPAGQLAPSFGTSGTIVHDSGGDLGAYADVLVLPDGRIVATGTATGPTGTADILVARFTATGAPDLSFGPNGRRYVDFGFTVDVARRLALQPDGRVLVYGGATAGVGDAAFNSADVVVARLNPDGSLDPSFGTAGKARVDLLGAYDNAVDLALDPAGNILLAATTYGGETYFDIRGAVARLTPNGLLDPSFGIAGKVVVHDPARPYIGASDLLLQPDGKILLLGTADYRIDSTQIPLPSRYDVALFRFNPNGSPDLSFGTQGLVLTDVEAFDEAGRLSLFPDGRILSINSAGEHFSAIVYRPDGSLDAGGAKLVRLSDTLFSVNGGTINDVAVQANGFILVAAGEAGRLTRLTPAFDVDPSFGINDDYDAPIHVNAIALQPNGRILLAGWEGEVDSNLSTIALARLVGDPTFPTTPSAPAAPSGLSATADFTGAPTITLTWTDRSTNETGFRVERSLDGVHFTPAGVAPANATTFVDTTFEGSTHYTYRVVAYANQVDSNPSNSATVSSLPFLLRGDNHPDTFNLSLSADALLATHTNSAGQTFTYSVPFDSVDSILVYADGGRDLLVLDLRTGNPVPAGGLTYLAFNSGYLGDGSDFTDTLTVFGDPAGNTFDLRGFGPSSSDTLLVLNGRTVSWDGVEHFDLNGAPAAADTLSVSGTLFGDIRFRGGAGPDTLNAYRGYYKFSIDPRTDTPGLIVNGNLAARAAGTDDPTAIDPPPLTTDPDPTPTDPDPSDPTPTDPDPTLPDEPTEDFPWPDDSDPGTTPDDSGGDDDWNAPPDDDGDIPTDDSGDFPLPDDIGDPDASPGPLPSPFAATLSVPKAAPLPGTRVTSTLTLTTPTERLRGKYRLTLFLSRDDSLSANDPKLLARDLVIDVRPARKQTFNVQYTIPANFPAGADFLLAKFVPVPNPAGDSPFVSATAITIAARRPLPRATAKVLRADKTRTTLRFTVTNAGTAPYNTAATLRIRPASATRSLVDSLPLTIKRKLNLKPGQSTTFTVTVPTASLPKARSYAVTIT